MGGLLLYKSSDFEEACYDTESTSICD
jgi:hypothetical protein